jgi:hypothetical protein
MGCTEVQVVMIGGDEPAESGPYRPPTNWRRGGWFYEKWNVEGSEKRLAKDF